MYTLNEMRRKEAAQDIDQFIMNTLVSKIRAYRIFFNVSQRELSRKSGVTQNIISRMENGIAIPQLQTLIKLLNTLELDIEINVKPREKDDKKILETLDEEKLIKMRELSQEIIKNESPIIDENDVDEEELIKMRKLSQEIIKNNFQKC